jgi:hypothetical protein
MITFRWIPEKKKLVMTKYIVAGWKRAKCKFDSCSWSLVGLMLRWFLKRDPINPSQVF